MDTFETLLAPGGAFAVTLGVAAFIVQQWRLGRQADVGYYKDKADRMKAWAERAERGKVELQEKMEQEIHEVRDGMVKYRQQLDDINNDMDRQVNKLIAQHREDLQRERRRSDLAVRLQHRYREALIECGANPDEIDAEFRSKLAPEGGI